MGIPDDTPPHWHQLLAAEKKGYTKEDKVRKSALLQLFGTQRGQCGAGIDAQQGYFYNTKKKKKGKKVPESL